jgi:uncharacterized protein YecA (UPF0149 family)
MRTQFIPSQPGQTFRKKIKGILIPGNGKPLMAKSIGRNALCKCGSGKKSKNCCGTDTKYFKQ